MKTTISYTVSAQLITLDEATSEAWEDGGELGDRTRQEVRRDAAILADQLGKSIEIESYDGITFDQIEPEETVSP